MNLFHCLNLPTDFLSTDPDTWESEDGYGVAKRRLTTLTVVNDTAERGVALIQEYNRTLTIKKKMTCSFCCRLLMIIVGSIQLQRKLNCSNFVFH